MYIHTLEAAVINTVGIYTPMTQTNVMRLEAVVMVLHSIMPCTLVWLHMYTYDGVRHIHTHHQTVADTRIGQE